MLLNSCQTSNTVAVWAHIKEQNTDNQLQIYYATLANQITYFCDRCRSESNVVQCLQNVEVINNAIASIIGYNQHKSSLSQVHIVLIAMSSLIVIIAISIIITLISTRCRIKSTDPVSSSGSV